MKNLIPGKKTYVVALGVVMSAVGAFLAGEASLLEAITAALTGLGLATLRLGIGDKDV